MKDTVCGRAALIRIHIRAGGAFLLPLPLHLGGPTPAHTHAVGPYFLPMRGTRGCHTGSSQARAYAMRKHQWFAHPGMLGAVADASAVLEKGRGACVQGVCVLGRWDGETRKALASERVRISPMELLAASEAVRMAASWGTVPSGRRFILRCDNESLRVTDN